MRYKHVPVYNKEPNKDLHLFLYILEYDYRLFTMCLFTIESPSFDKYYSAKRALDHTFNVKNNKMNFYFVSQVLR